MHDRILEVLKSERLVGIVRSENVEDADKKMHRLIEGGVRLIEMTWTVPHAAELLQTARRNPAIFCGAGTILDASMAHEAMEAGAQYIVAPNFDPEVAEFARERQLLYIPGVFSATEVARVLRSKITLMKLFPAATGGVDHLRALHEPFPQAQFLVTGGITTQSGPQWMRAGALALGLGGGLGHLSLEEIRRFRGTIAGNEP